MKHLALLLFTVTFNLHLLFAAVPLKWTVETSRVQPAQFDAYHGEELALAATLQSYGRPLAIPSDADLRLFWQTNGMGSAYWSTNAVLASSNVISAVFRPSYDPGVPVVAGFIGVPSSNYRAAFTIRFRGSPGATPFNPPPSPAVEYYTKAEVDSKLETAVGVTPGAVTNIAGRVVTNAVPAWALEQNPPVTSLEPATNYTDAVLAPIASQVSSHSSQLSQMSQKLSAKQDALPYATNAIPAGVIANAPWLTGYTETDPTVAAWAKSGQPQPQTSLEPATNYTDAVLAPIASQVSSQAARIVTITNQMSGMSDSISIFQDYVDGSNVVFSITNYVSGAYRSDAAKLRILELTGGVYREVYNSRDEIALHLADFATNDFRSATNAIVTEVGGRVDAFAAEIDAKAPKAWGRYSSSGEDIHALGITNAVYMTAPTTYFAGGYDWYRVSCGEGAVCVLTANGAAANTYGEDGTFFFKDLTTTNYFGFRTRDNFIIGCDADDIHTYKTSGNRTCVVLDFYVDSPTYPILLYRPTLENFSSNSWEQLNDANGLPLAGSTYAVSWTNHTDGLYSALINVGTNAAGFFTARTVVQGEAEFVTNMKSDLKGGIVTTDGQHIVKPVYADGELTWQTFDYGTTNQVSTTTKSYVNKVASLSISTSASYVDNNYQKRIADYTTTNAVKDIVSDELHVSVGDGAAIVGSAYTDTHVQIGKGAKAWQSTKYSRIQNDNIAIGPGALAGGNSTNETENPYHGYHDLAVGESAVANGSGAVAVGSKAFATNECSVAVGWRSTATGWNSVMLGFGTNTEARSLAVGFRDTPTYKLLGSNGKIPFDRISGFSEAVIDGSKDYAFSPGPLQTISVSGTGENAGGREVAIVFPDTPAPFYVYLGEGIPMGATGYRTGIRIEMDSASEKSVVGFPITVTNLPAYLEFRPLTASKYLVNAINLGE